MELVSSLVDVDGVPGVGRLMALSLRSAGPSRCVGPGFRRWQHR